MPRSGQVGSMTDPAVVLYTFPRSVLAPNLSPFAVKMETFLRMAQINYTNSFGRKLSPKGKTPWITYNGKPIGDSSLIIEFLTENTGTDLDKSLNPEQKAMAHAIQKMVEDNLYWTVVRMRWEFHHKVWLNKVAGMPKILVWVLGRRAKKQTIAQGMGRHSYEDVLHIMKNDLNALSVTLGNKDFVMGSEATQVDAAVFGQLSQIVYAPDSPGMKMCKETFPNLWSYCERMKETFWPDWDDCITHGGTKKPTK